MNPQNTEIETLRLELAKLRDERDAAMVPICIGQPIIDILAKEGQWVSMDGLRGLIAADDLFRNSPYAERDAALARVKEAEEIGRYLLARVDRANECGLSDSPMLQRSRTFLETKGDKTV